MFWCSSGFEENKKGINKLFSKFLQLLFNISCRKAIFQNILNKLIFLKPRGHVQSEVTRASCCNSAVHRHVCLDTNILSLKPAPTPRAGPCQAVPGRAVPGLLLCAAVSSRAGGSRQEDFPPPGSGVSSVGGAGSREAAAVPDVAVNTLRL